MKTSFFICAVLVLVAGTVAADPARKPAPKTEPLACPITGEKIASASSAYNHETYKGKTYYFCCAACKPIFDKNPAKIAADAAKGKYQNQ